MRRFTFFLVALCLFSVSACQKAPELTVTSPSSIELGVDGSSNTITFTANRDWSVRSSDSWVSVSPISGTASDEAVTVRVSCSANTTYEDRTATITITMEELTQTVSVKQSANLGIILPTQSYNLASDARSIEVEVKANVQYAVSISDSWIKQTGTKGLTSNKLTFSVEENDTYDARSATITIKPQNATVQEQVISVKQAQKDALIVKDTSFDMPYGGGEIEVKVEANVSFDVKPSEDWIHDVETKALSGSTVRLKVDENPTYSAREGKIEIKQKNGTLSHTLAVKQAGRIAVTSIELNKTSLTLKEGESEMLMATVKPDNATDKTVTWSSSDENVATVDNGGQITAIKVGASTITAKAGDQSATCTVIISKEYVYVAEAIDLGLSVKWSSTNLGASQSLDPGARFMWGETEASGDESGWAAYKWSEGTQYTLTKYCTLGGYGEVDNKIHLDKEDDAAQVLLGNGWRMPRSKELQELFNNCKREYIVDLKGYLLTSKINGNSIFLPEGLYWSNEIASGYPYLALASSWSWGDYVLPNHSGQRCYKASIRPVHD